MIIGAHSIIYSADPEADRAFLRDILALNNVDVGEGWLIFGLPPAEVAVHPADENSGHELYLMTDDVEGFMADMEDQDISCGPVKDQGWGLLTELTLPGGGKLGVYEPRHARPESMAEKKKPAAKGKGKAKAKATKPSKAPARAKAAAKPKKAVAKATKPAAAKKKGKRR